MASTRRFMTGGGYPYPWSPGRPIEFTLSYGKSDRFDPESTHPQYNNRLDFSDPEAPAYVCAMLEPPRDEVGLTNFGRELGQAYQDVAADPAYAALPVPPLSFQDLRQAQASANSDIRSGSIAASCQWARRFAPGAKLSIDSASGADAVPYRAQARDGYNRVIGEHLALPNGNQAGAGFDISGLPSWMQNALAYQPQDGADGAASSNNDHKSTQTDPSNVRVLSSPYFAPGASPLQPTRASPPQQFGPLPIFGLHDQSAATGDDASNWLARWMPLLR